MVRSGCLDRHYTSAPLQPLAAHSRKFLQSHSCLPWSDSAPASPLSQADYTMCQSDGKEAP